MDRIGSSRRGDSCGQIEECGWATAAPAGFAGGDGVESDEAPANWSSSQMDGAALLEMYRQRGTAEGHMGELMSVLDPALSSSPRPKGHYRGEQPTERFAAGDSFAQNEVLLLLNVLAYSVVHATRVMLETATGEGWSMKRVRERVLRVAARILVHGRRAVLVIGKSSDGLWAALWRELHLLHAPVT